MQLGLHNDRMTVETKNYNVKTENEYLYSYLHRVWFSDSYAISIIFEKTYIKKTYQDQHINFVRPKVWTSVQKSLPKIFLGFSI